MGGGAKENKSVGSRRKMDREDQSKTAGRRESEKKNKKKKNRFICNEIVNHPFLLK